MRLLILLLTSIKLFTNALIGVPTDEIQADMIMQNPELPNGCEVTSLAIVLNEMGYSVSKETLADDFLPMGEIGKTHPDEAFPGTPRGRGYGCNPSVLAKVANDYLDSLNDDSVSVLTYEGVPLELASYFINNDNLVIIWTSTDMKPKENYTIWNLDSGDYTWYFKFHCVVLSKFDFNTCVVLDPLLGRVEYPTDLVKEIYEDRGSKMMVLIKESN